MNNPFWYGNPVPPQQLIGRQEVLRKITSRITTGQSTALIGPPQSGKTSILHYLMSPENQAMLYQERAAKLMFSYLDANLWLPQFTLVDFWKSALSPLQQRLRTDFPSLADSYQHCQDQQFAAESLKILFTQLKQLDWRLVLVIDGFDVLLSPPIPNDVELFGGLRALASTEPNTKEALVLIVSGNTPLYQLDEQTRQYSRRGSPYFNFMQEILLKLLPDSEIDQLQEKGRPHFTTEDKSFLKTLTGGHPYLLQVAAFLLWDLYEQGPETNLVQRQQHIEPEFYRIVNNTLLDTWQSWTNKMREVFIAVTLSQLQEQKDPRCQELQQAGVDLDRRISELKNFPSTALKDLELYGGWVVKTEDTPSGWRVKVGAYLPFVVNRVKQLSQESQLSSPPAETRTVVTETKEMQRANEILNYLFTLRFWLIVMFCIVFGEMVGLAIIAGFRIEPTNLLAYIIQFSCAGIGGLKGYQLGVNLSSWLQNKENHVQRT